MVELELLERRQRTVAYFEELEPPALLVVELVEHIRLGLRLAEERQRDRDDAGDGERRGEHQCQGQRVAGSADRRTCARRAFAARGGRAIA